MVSIAIGTITVERKSAQGRVMKKESCMRKKESRVRKNRSQYLCDRLAHENVAIIMAGRKHRHLALQWDRVCSSSGSQSHDPISEQIISAAVSPEQIIMICREIHSSFTFVIGIRTSISVTFDNIYCGNSVSVSASHDTMHPWGTTEKSFK